MIRLMIVWLCGVGWADPGVGPAAADSAPEVEAGYLERLETLAAELVELGAAVGESVAETVAVLQADQAEVRTTTTRGHSDCRVRPELFRHPTSAGAHIARSYGVPAELSFRLAEGEQLVGVSIAPEGGAVVPLAAPAGLSEDGRYRVTDLQSELLFEGQWWVLVDTGAAEATCVPFIVVSGSAFSTCPKSLSADDMSLCRAMELYQYGQSWALEAHVQSLKGEAHLIGTWLLSQRIP